MRIEKRKIVDLPMVYVTGEIFLQGKRYLAAVSEARGEKAYLIDPETGEYAELWQGDTGDSDTGKGAAAGDCAFLSRFSVPRSGSMSA